ncbi:hypothetical protein CF336_g7430 [Tilletia laevis]|nr:hypothetical protein CF336_g7430 [Tilletia laevis]KAE8188196.1 hypothetical protein CF335_g6958 [Tilletia laevis]
MVAITILIGVLSLIARPALADCPDVLSVAQKPNPHGPPGAVTGFLVSQRAPPTLSCEWLWCAQAPNSEKCHELCACHIRCDTVRDKQRCGKKWHDSCYDKCSELWFPGYDATNPRA